MFCTDNATTGVNYPQTCVSHMYVHSKMLGSDVASGFIS